MLHDILNFQSRAMLRAYFSFVRYHCEHFHFPSIYRWLWGHWLLCPWRPRNGAKRLIGRPMRCDVLDVARGIHLLCLHDYPCGATRELTTLWAIQKNRSIAEASTAIALLTCQYLAGIQHAGMFCVPTWLRDKEDRKLRSVRMEAVYI
jgi:hypothetical protein